MRGNLWTLTVATIGAGLMLRAAGAAAPSNPASTTTDVLGLYETVAPFAGQLFAVAGFGALIFYAIRVN